MESWIFVIVMSGTTPDARKCCLYLYDFAFEGFTYHMTLATVHQGYAYLVSHDVQIVWVRDAGSSAAVTSQVHSIGCREPHREIMMPNRNWH